MTTNYKGFQIDYKDSGAVIYKDGKFIKAFASDDPNTAEVKGVDKAKKYIDAL
jgi:hypothetical protein